MNAAVFLTAIPMCAARAGWSTKTAVPALRGGGCLATAPVPPQIRRWPVKYYASNATNRPVSMSLRLRRLSPLRIKSREPRNVIYNVIECRFNPFPALENDMSRVICSGQLTFVLFERFILDKSRSKKLLF